jgi:hypothetical protein
MVLSAYLNERAEGSFRGLREFSPLGLDQAMLITWFKRSARFACEPIVVWNRAAI